MREKLRGALTFLPAAPIIKFYFFPKEAAYEIRQAIRHHSPISFAGEALNYLLPLPVPASIYGLVLMFLCLQLRVFRLEDVRDTALFLIEIMPLMFIPAATGLMTSWGIIRAKLFAYLVIAVITTVLVMVVSGRVTQFFLRRGKEV